MIMNMVYLRKKNGPIYEDLEDYRYVKPTIGRNKKIAKLKDNRSDVQKAVDWLVP